MLGSTKPSTSLKFKHQGDQLCDQLERAAARHSKILKYHIIYNSFLIQELQLKSVSVTMETRTQV